MSDFKQLTVVYDVTDMAAWEKAGNPLRYEHHGMKAHTVSIYDAIARCHRLEEELNRLCDVVDYNERRSIREALDL